MAIAEQPNELKGLEYFQLPDQRYAIFQVCGDSLVFREYYEGAFFMEDKTTGRWGRITGFNNKEEMKQYIKEKLQDPPL